jgi:hypothetical protein
VPEHPKHPGQTQGLSASTNSLFTKKELFQVTDQWIDLAKQTEIQDTHAVTPGQTACLPSGPFRHGL